MISKNNDLEKIEAIFNEIVNSSLIIASKDIIDKFKLTFDKIIRKEI